MLTLTEKFENFMNTVNMNEFLNYYYSHNDSDVLHKYNLTNGLFKMIKKELKLSKTKEQIRNIQKNTWESKPTSKINKNNLLLEKLSKEEIENYYIVNNNTFEDTYVHFNISSNDLLFLIKHYNLYKDKHLSKIHADNTKQSKYGNKNYNNREKSKITCLEKYGVDNPFKDVENMKKSYLNKLGVEHPMKLQLVVDKCVLNHDYKTLLDKTRNTNLHKYGVEIASVLPHVKEKIKSSVENTFNERYGCSCYFTMPNANISYNSCNSSYNIAFSELLSENHIIFNTEVSINKYRYDFKVGNNLIEVNPTATHNSTWSPFGNHCGIAEDYHFNKTKFAKENGYRCINVWDWDEVDKIISLLKERNTLYARKCFIKELDVKECKSFINEHHLQGYVKSEINIGLYFNDELVSVMTFGKPRYNKNYEYELIRYCSSYNVIGGAEKIFKYFIKTYNPESIISYCDNSKFNGDTYIKLGFNLKSYGEPSKHWYNPKTKKHITDNLLRQRGFDQLLGKEYGCFGKGTSNEQLMLEHDFVEIYDCGQSVYTYKLV